MRTLEFRTGLMQDKSVTTIPARVFDPARPMWWLAGVGVVMTIAGIVSLCASIAHAELLFFGGIATVIGWDLRFRRRPRARTLVCKPGSIRARGSGLIRARDIEGATTARVGDRLALFLAHRRRRRQPIILELEDDAALHTVCKSLGIGHHGFGFIDVVVNPTHAERGSRVMYALGVACLLAAFIEAIAPFAALGVTFAALGAVIFACVRFGTSGLFMRVTSAGIYLPSGMFIAFSSIDDVRIEGNALVVVVRTERGTPALRLPIRCVSRERRGMTRDELEHVVAQIRSASERAHGKFAMKTQPEVLAARLSRNEGETDADWRARIDTLAAGAGYRALAADPAELWSLLEDPEASADVREGAARVLRRLDKAALRVRVTDVLATVRDEETRTRIAGSIEEEEEEEPPPDSQSAAHS